MSTAHDFRRIALSLDGTTSAPHFHRTAFKVARIFATLALKAALEPAWQHALPRKPASRTRRQMTVMSIEVMSMQYAILCYHDEKVTCAWSREHDNAIMARLAVVHDKLARQGKLGPVARLLPTTTATTLRKDREPALVIDGPFAETKEQLLGFYVVDCADLDEVLGIARELGQANPGGAYEIRPIGAFRPGKLGT
jgi:hypothetical protein